MFITYADLIGDRINDLLVIRDSKTEQSWLVGDITNERILLNPTALRHEVYSAISSFVGPPSRTIREYAAMAEFYSLYVRNKYAVLSYNHFRFAKTKGDKWQEVLDYAVAQVDEINRPATVDSCYARFTAVEDVDLLRKFLDDLRERFERICSRLTPEQRAEVETAIVEIENIIMQEKVSE